MVVVVAVDSRDVPLSLPVTQAEAMATNGLFFQSFLASVFFFVCALSSIHLFMSPFSSPFLSYPPTPLPPLLLLHRSFLSLHFPAPLTHPSSQFGSCPSLCLLHLSACLSDFAAIVRSSTRSHAGVPGGQAARRKPPPASQPGHTLPAHQCAPSE